MKAQLIMTAKNYINAKKNFFYFFDFVFIEKEIKIKVEIFLIIFLVGINHL
jgi:hypothetical protein